MTPWVTGDTITAERLNGMMGVVVNDNDGFTYNQLAEAMEGGRVVILYSSYVNDGVVQYASNLILFDIEYNSGMARYIARFGSIGSDSGSAIPTIIEYRQSDPNGTMYIPD